MVTLPMTSRDYEVIVVAEQHSKSKCFFFDSSCRN